MENTVKNQSTCLQKIKNNVFSFVQNICSSCRKRGKKEEDISINLGMHSVLFIMRMYEFLFLFIEKWIQYGTER